MSTTQEVTDDDMIGIVAQVCPETEDGWVWHCEEHDRHGIARSQSEALEHAEIHNVYHCDLDAPTGCNVLVWSVDTYNYSDPDAPTRHYDDMVWHQLDVPDLYVAQDDLDGLKVRPRHDAG